MKHLTANRECGKQHSPAAGMDQNRQKAAWPGFSNPSSFRQASKR